MRPVQEGVHVEDFASELPVCVQNGSKVWAPTRLFNVFLLSNRKTQSISAGCLPWGFLEVASMGQARDPFVHSL